METEGWTRAEKAGALLLLLLAAGLTVIGTDILFGGRLLKKDCCPEGEGAPVDG